jgi:hypothetical protein
MAIVLPTTALVAHDFHAYAASAPVRAKIYALYGGWKSHYFCWTLKSPIDDWARKHLGYPVYIFMNYQSGENAAASIVEFETEEDMIAFKLKWL